jgi:hypothetical protein
MAWHRQKLPFPMPTPEDEPARDLHRQGAEDAALRGEENELLGDSSASSAPLR